MFKPVRIANLDINPPLVLSPMSGVTTSPFRRLIKEVNPGAVGLVVSEFVSVEGMTRGSKKTLDMMRFKDEERPIGIQIFGYDIDRMRSAALMAEDLGADLVDINCGCPAPKVVKKGGGCELMRQPDHLRKILSSVRRAVKIPLTLKMRSGWDSTSENALEIGKIAQEEGVDSVTIHGRTRAQLYRGDADWHIAGELSRHLRIPVFGSGDVVNRHSADKAMGLGVSGLYIGRAALFNPYVFQEIVHNEPISIYSEPKVALLVTLRYIELLLSSFEPRSCVGKVKQIVSQSPRRLPWRKDILRATTLEEQIGILKKAGDAQSFEYNQIVRI